MSEPTLVELIQQLQEFKQTNEKQLEEIKQEIKEVKAAIDKLDSRLFELSMRMVTANSSAFFGVGIASLSAAIAFVVARISGGSFCGLLQVVFLTKRSWYITSTK